jgi:hypothetical protein
MRVFLKVFGANIPVLRLNAQDFGTIRQNHACRILFAPHDGKPLETRRKKQFLWSRKVQ